MDTILSFHKWQVAFIYLVDIFIFPKSPGKHTYRLRQVPTLLNEAEAVKT